MTAATRLTLLLAVLLAGVSLNAAAANAGGPTMALGAAEDAVRADDLVGAQAQMNLLRLAGMSSVRITSNWLPGLVAPTEAELRTLRNVEGAAQLSGVRVFVSVYHPGSKTTPLTPEARAEFAAVHGRPRRRAADVDDIIIGNEPNLNRFWLPAVQR